MHNYYNLFLVLKEFWTKYLLEIDKSDNSMCLSTCYEGNWSKNAYNQYQCHKNNVINFLIFTLAANY